jgi:hypothetical protein
MAVTVALSEIIYNNLQVDGRSNVREHHLDSAGNHYYFDYVNDGSINTATRLAADAIAVLVNAAEKEVFSNINAITSIGSLATPVFVYSTVAQNVAALRIVYALSTRTQAIMIGDFFNTLTATQVQNAFGITAQQYATLQPTLIAAATQATAIRAAVGQ